MVQTLLRNYQDLTLNDELLDLKIDLDRALNKPDLLTSLEKKAIVLLYFRNDVALIRTGKPGPPFDSLHREVAKTLFPQKGTNAAKIELTRTIQRACAKISHELGEDYQ